MAARSLSFRLAWFQGYAEKLSTPFPSTSRKGKDLVCWLCHRKPLQVTTGIFLLYLWLSPYLERGWVKPVTRKCIYTWIQACLHNDNHTWVIFLHSILPVMFLMSHNHVNRFRSLKNTAPHSVLWNSGIFSLSSALLDFAFSVVMRLAWELRKWSPLPFDFWQSNLVM